MKRREDKRAWGFDITEYKSILDKYNVEYVKHEKRDVFAYALIEIKEVEELFALAKELKYGLIVNDYPDEDTVITIHDDYIE